MCEPTTLIGAAMMLSVAQVGLQAGAQQQGNKAKGQAAALQRKAFGSSVASISSKLAKDQIVIADEKQSKRLEALQRQSLSRVNASTSNITGFSVDAVLADFDRQAGSATSSLDQSLKLSTDSANQSIKASSINTEGALFNLRKEAFNPAAAALQIGGAAFSAYASTYKPGGGSVEEQRTQFDSFGDPLNG